VKRIATVLKPEFVVMSGTLTMALQRSFDDTQILIKGMNIAKEVDKLVTLAAARQTKSASKQVAVVLGMVNDQVNADSFMGSLLNKLDFGWESLPECVQDVHKIGHELRTAAFALEISPRKWTIDKGDSEVAMRALQNVVQYSRDAANNCKQQIQALSQLLKGLQQQLGVTNGRIELFHQNIGQILWALLKAVIDRDWIATGQQVAELAVIAMDNFKLKSHLLA